MDRVTLVKNAYNKELYDNLYDSIIMNSNFKGHLYNKFIFGLDDKKIDILINKIFESLKENDKRKILDVSIETGVLNIPIYKSIKNLKVIALDDGLPNTEIAKKRCENLNAKNISFVEGNAYNLPFKDETFSCVISINGFNTFINKPKAFNEIYRVLKPGGTFIGSFYIRDENSLRDFFRIFASKKILKKYYYSTSDVIEKYTKKYDIEEIGNVGSIIYFTMKKR